MGGTLKYLLVPAIAALLAIGPAACGGSDSTGSTSTATVGTAKQTTTTPSAGEHGSGGGEKPRGGSSYSPGEGSASFRTPGGDNSIQNFGKEADSAEIEEAAAAIAGYMRPRARDEWAKECAYLAKAAVAPLEKLASSLPQLKGKGCAEVLAALEGKAPTSTRANTFSDIVASLRVEGERGFALYHGADGVDYFVSMVKEDGKWRVGALAPSEFP